jgi:hypothetical protein
MAASQDYRQFAEECLRWARETEDEPQRQLFLEMASAWVQAASLQDGKPPIAPNANPSAAPEL